jgi:signal transduction histidine kinase
MPDPIWYRSLYWRIALGFVALLATLLVVQGLVFLWMTGRMMDFFPSRSPAQFAVSMAADLSAALTDQPDTDIQAYVNKDYARAFRSFVVVTRDGRTAVSQRVPPPPGMTRAARGRLMGDVFADRGGGPAPGPPGPGRGGPGRGGRGGDPYGRPYRSGDGRGGPPGTALEFASIIVNSMEVGLVAVPLEPPPLSVALRDLGPTLAIVALALLVTGTAFAALLVFRPANKRLRGLQQAAIALGAGQAGVRAPESGGDEVTSLAHAFNEMAGRLEERTHALEHADQTRRQLLADVSHELTTPLAAIRGYVETLEMQTLGLDDPTKHRYLGIINEETERLEHIVGDLLDLARLEGGGGTFKREPVLIAQLFDRVRRRHEQRLADLQITLETSQAASVETVTGDANRLEQALQNLVANAVRHTPSGGTVRVTAARVAEGVELVVADSGPGIPPEHLPRVFDRFYKVDVSRTGTETPSGSGLGLSIVRAIVARHGGTITASNAYEGGARFTILLPGGREGDDTAFSEGSSTGPNTPVP